MHRIVTPTSNISLFHPICKYPLQHGLIRWKPRTRVFHSPKANFSISHGPHFRDSKAHAKWSVPRGIQDLWNSLKASFGPKTQHELSSKKGVNNTINLELSSAIVDDPQPKPKPPGPKSAKKHKKKIQPPNEPTHQPLTEPPRSHPNNHNKSAIDQYFYLRLQQTLCHFYVGILSGTLRASPEVKTFIRTTHFNDAFLLLYHAVLPETKLIISHTPSLPRTYTKLRRNCLVPNQGCYMNIITTPQDDIGVYIGGAGSTAKLPRATTRPLRGELDSPPYTQRRPGVPCGVGRRVTQHLDDGVRMRKGASAHYRFMQREGSRYDFRLLAVFGHQVQLGAVWVLEAFFVQEIGTMSGSRGVAREYVGLNRACPLKTNCRLRTAAGEEKRR